MKGVKIFPLLAALSIALAIPTYAAKKPYVKRCGKLNVSMEMDFEHGTMSHDYILDSPFGKRYHYMPDNMGDGMVLPDTPGCIKGRKGKRSKIYSVPVGGVRVTGVAPSTATSLGPDENLGPQRFCAIVTDFPDRPLDVPFADIQAQYTNVVKPFYEEMSFGRTTISSTKVVGPFHQTRQSNQTCPSPTDYNAIQLASGSLNIATECDFVDFIAPYNCGWGGIAYLGRVEENTAQGILRKGWNANTTTYGARVLGGIIGHELGHNFRAHHSGFINCGSIPLNPNKGSCSLVEYGNPYSDLSNYAFGPNYLIGHFDALQKKWIGWLDTTEYLIDPPNGQYTIEALERVGGLKALFFTRTPTDLLAVQTRAAIGFDAGYLTPFPNSNIYQGVQLTTTDDIFGGQYALGKPMSIDAHSPYGENVSVALQPGETFTDPLTGRSITTLSRTSDRAVVEIGMMPTTTTTTLPPCCSCGLTMPAEGGTINGTTTGNTNSFQPSCVTLANHAPDTMVYWTAPRSGATNIITCPLTGTTNFDTVLSVRLGGCGSGPEIACNDDSQCALSTLNSNITFNAVAGQTYTIVVDGYNGASGTFALTLYPPTGGPATTTTTQPSTTTTTVSTSTTTVRPSTTTTTMISTTTLPPPTTTTTRPPTTTAPTTTSTTVRPSTSTTGPSTTTTTTLFPLNLRIKGDGTLTANDVHVPPLPPGTPIQGIVVRDDRHL